MPTTRPRVPGWHPDPDDPMSLRHWDGKRWGQERRPRPSWAKPVTATALTATGKGGDGDPPPQRSNGPRRWWWFAAVGSLLCALAVVTAPAWLGAGPDIPARSVGDRTFTTQADALCKEELAPIKADRPESREETGANAAFAKRVDKAADDLADVAADLRALPVAAADAARVDGWLDEWDAYVALGREYADRLRAGDENATRDIAAESTPVSTRIFVFAKSNDMPSCTL